MKHLKALREELLKRYLRTDDRTLRDAIWEIADAIGATLPDHDLEQIDLDQE